MEIVVDGRFSGRDGFGDRLRWRTRQRWGITRYISIAWYVAGSSPARAM
jgi:hypothetical protein